MVTPIEVLYLGGVGRSGSTLLEMMLAQSPDVAALGEVVHLWRRGVQRNQLCSCRLPFVECPFWTEVGERAFGGFASVPLERLEWLKSRIDRQRYAPLLASPLLPAARAAAASEYAGYFERIYRAAHETAGGLVLDSSKHPSLAFILARHPRISLRVVHVVRDSRGVAYSHSRWVKRPETTGDLYMPRAGAAGTAATWLSHNAMFELLRRRGVPVMRLRYEDLVTDPAGSLLEVRRFAGLAELEGVAEFLSSEGSPQRSVHSVSGNPLRFSDAPFRIRPDEAWRTEMSARERQVVWALTAPLAIAYGYRVRK